MSLLYRCRGSHTSQLREGNVMKHADGSKYVRCFVCGRELRMLKHPNSFRFCIIPGHNKPQGQSR